MGVATTPSPRNQPHNMTIYGGSSLDSRSWSGVLPCAGKEWCRRGGAARDLRPSSLCSKKSRQESDGGLACPGAYERTQRSIRPSARELIFRTFSRRACAYLSRETNPGRYAAPCDLQATHLKAAVSGCQGGIAANGPDGDPGRPVGIKSYRQQSVQRNAEPRLRHQPLLLQRVNVRSTLMLARRSARWFSHDHQ